MPCRINRRKIWTTRLVLEGHAHSENCFITLTYKDESLPKPPSVRPTDLATFLNPLKLFYPDMRYFAIGEYGSLRSRPHYHLLLFGRNLQKAAAEWLWPHGFVDVAAFNLSTAAYVAGYIADKLKLAAYPDGIAPPFCRLSTKPGLGHSAVPLLTRICRSEAGQKYIAEVGDIPTAVKFDNKLWPIGRYLAGKVREEIGLDNKAETQAKRLTEQRLIEMTPELYDVQERKRQVAADRAAAWHRRRRAKLRL